MWVKWAREAGFDVLLNRPFKALHNNWGKCNRAVVVKTTDDFYGNGIIVADFRQDGMCLLTGTG